MFLKHSKGIESDTGYHFEYSVRESLSGRVRFEERLRVIHAVIWDRLFQLWLAHWPKRSFTCSPLLTFSEFSLAFPVKWIISGGGGGFFFYYILGFSNCHFFVVNAIFLMVLHSIYDFTLLFKVLKLYSKIKKVQYHYPPLDLVSFYICLYLFSAVL